MTFNAPGPFLPLVREGKIRTLAVTSLARAPFAPDLPTMRESGFDNFEVLTWLGLFVPAKTPRSVIAWLNHETVRIMNSPDVNARVIALGNMPLTNILAEFAGIIEREKPFWERLIKDAGVKPIE